MEKGVMDLIAGILVIIGALNWGLIAINPSYNVVAMMGETVARIIYGLVGLAGLWAIYMMFKK